MSGLDERLDEEARLINTVTKQERAATHNALARAERAENALKKALARVEELETALQGVLAETLPLTRKPWMARAGNPPQMTAEEAS